MQKEMRERLAHQEEIEQKTKADMNAQAKTYLSSFYEVQCAVNLDRKKVVRCQVVITIRESGFSSDPLGPYPQED